MNLNGFTPKQLEDQNFAEKLIEADRVPYFQAYRRYNAPTAKLKRLFGQATSSFRRRASSKV